MAPVPAGRDIRVHGHPLNHPVVVTLKGGIGVPHEIGVGGYGGMLSVTLGTVALQEDPEQGLLSPESSAGQVQLVRPVQVLVDASFLDFEHETGILYQGGCGTVAREFMSSSLEYFSVQLHIVLKCRPLLSLAKQG